MMNKLNHSITNKQPNLGGTTYWSVACAVDMNSIREPLEGFN
jgi:hypothetical protein